MLNDNINNVVDMYGLGKLILVGDLNEDLLNPNLRHLGNIYYI
jgi:hypothetical protein